MASTDHGIVEEEGCGKRKEKLSKGEVFSSREPALH
jgi:hypothetical protein